MLKKIYSDKINVTKTIVFFSQALTNHSFTFNSQFLYELKQKIHLSKTVCTIIHFGFCFGFFLRFFFFFSIKSMGSMTLKLHIYLQSKNNRKGTHSFAPLLSYRKKLETLMYLSELELSKK